jgi:hypothetical protein
VRPQTRRHNFGFVTRFTARSCPSAKIRLALPAYQITKVLTAFHECVGSADVADPRTTYDPCAVGPIACFSYMAAIGVQVVFVNLTYTKPPENAKKWPARWSSSAFGSLWLR